MVWKSTIIGSGNWKVDFPERGEMAYQLHMTPTFLSKFLANFSPESNFLFPLPLPFPPPPFEERRRRRQFRLTLDMLISSSFSPPLFCLPLPHFYSDHFLSKHKS